MPSPVCLLGIHCMCTVPACLACPAGMYISCGLQWQIGARPLDSLRFPSLPF
ncbi:hypothetical protein BO71DRAFT_399092 [Aspergillus ellipticus CBS 707.79]|uniref:Uncharacterized protein n=1 Tax=Aspergillus ellipticus CBS 707.79 TaxID=1448320 RepID=A0A319DA45_9EURO|nr:hypothetical protein BO71DRAFT_399092 [Aspergillus ellipticus CBS 707.79]